jgi:hypothetical protein
MADSMHLNNHTKCSLLQLEIHEHKPAKSSIVNSFNLENICMVKVFSYVLCSRTFIHLWNISTF